MNFFVIPFLYLLSLSSLIILVILGVQFLIRKKEEKDFYKRTAYLMDCPFKYALKIEDDEYIIFVLDTNTTLWCEYSMGIRSDGVYGVSHLEVRGLNGPYSNIKLEVGQSIFPIIEKIDQFEEWADGKAFKAYWNKDFLSEWEDMRKELDNLRYLETKSQEKDKNK